MGDWVFWKPGQPWPHNAIVGGAYKEGGQNNPIYIARRGHESSAVIGYAYKDGPMYFGWHGAELSYSDYEIFCSSKYLLKYRQKFDF
jgi:hypothetical protein